jgi:hypothetical protein
MLEQLAGIHDGCRSRADVVDEDEHRHGESMGDGVRYWALLHVPARESVGQSIKPTEAISHGEIKAEQLADPLVLRHC